MSSLNKTEARKRRHLRVRKKISGSPEKPRLAVFRSNKHIYAQIIDDVQAKTLVSASTSILGIKDKKVTSNTEAAKEVGKSIAKKAKDKGINEVVFDRGGYLYHGRVKSLAEAARENGLNF